MVEKIQNVCMWKVRYKNLLDKDQFVFFPARNKLETNYPALHM